MTETNRSMPPGTIIPELIYDDMEAAATWLCTNFGFRKRLRIGNHRFQLLVGSDAAIVVVQRPEEVSRESPFAHSLMIRVDDVDAHYERVKQRGARIVSSPTDFPYGERQYTVEDLAGRRWTFSQSITDVDPSTWGGKLLDSDV